VIVNERKDVVVFVIHASDSAPLDLPRVLCALPTTLSLRGVYLTKTAAFVRWKRNAGDD
jgi:hypothetical protein